MTQLLVELKFRQEEIPHKYICKVTSIPDLLADLKKCFNIDQPILVTFFDEEFNQYISLDSIAQLKDKGKIQISLKHSDTVARFEEIVEKMKDVNNGLKLKTRKWRLKSYNDTFTGSEFIDWAVKNLNVPREEALELGKKLMKENYFHHILQTGQFFTDDKGAFYQWQDLGDMKRKPTVPPNLDENELALGLLSPLTGVETKERKNGFRKFKVCFLGSDAVSWISKNLDVRRNIAITIGQRLMNNGYFHHITYDEPFLDGPYLYTSKDSKRPTTEFPAERVIRLLQKLKSEQLFEGNIQDIDFVINALANGHDFFNPDVETLLNQFKIDSLGRSLVLSYTGGPNLTPSQENLLKKKEKKSEGIQSGLDKITQISDPLLQLLEKVCDWDFDIFQLHELTNGQSLLVVTFAIFEKLDLFHKFDIDRVKCRNFFKAISDGYRDNPYHNCIHAADVTQTMNYILTRGGLSQLITDLDTLGALVSAAIHDHDHPGLNNAYMISSKSEIAILYNDQSPLENHHCSSAFRVLMKEENNIFSSLDKEQFLEIRKLITSMVLATDFGKHFDFLGRFKSTINSNDVDMKKLDTRIIYLELALKLADISHTAKPLPLHLNWTYRITEEFYNQGDQERKHFGVASPSMDRTLGNVAKSQTGFISFMVLPLFQAWVEEFENTKECLQRVEENLAHWKSEASKGTSVQLDPPPQYLNKVRSKSPTILFSDDEKSLGLVCKDFLETAFEDEHHLAIESIDFKEYEKSYILNNENAWSNKVRHPCEVASSLLLEISSVYLKLSSLATRNAVKSLNKSTLFKEFSFNACELQKAQLKGLSNDELLSFWINVYNTLMLHAHAHYGFTKTAKRGLQFWKSSYEIGGFRFSLIEIEYCILRAELPISDDFGRMFLSFSKFDSKDPRSKFVCSAEPLINFVISSGARSHPPICVISHTAVKASLTKQAITYLRENVVINEKEKELVLPRYLFWRRKDFGKTGKEMLTYIAEFLGEKKADCLSLIDNFTTSIKFSNFDWNFDLNFKNTNA